MQEFLYSLSNAKSIKLLLIVILLDTIFGVLRALKEKKINSAIGIDGIIRKAGMILSTFFFKLIDCLVSINLISFMPQGFKDFLGTDNVGLTFLFIILFIVFEALSIMKNMIKCKMPIPKKLQGFLEKILKEFTTELENK